MRLSALCAGLAMAGLSIASAQTACLKANAPDQVAEGRLTSVRISIPDYKLKEQAYILRLASDACLEGSGEFDKVERTNRIHVFAMDDALRKRLRSLAGQRVRVTGEPLGEHTAHHHAPIVLRVARIERVARK
jgi:uncharacterized protein DUF4431